MKDLTISIVAYQNYDDIMQAVETIEKYTNESIDKHIYIIDNSCYDKTNKQRQRFTNFLEKWQDVEYLDTETNLGFGKGHNYVLDRVDSKYHAIVNPDIVLLDDSFQKIMDFQDETGAGIVVPRLVDVTGTMIKAYRREVTIGDMFIRYFCPGLFQKRKDYHTMDEMDYTQPFEVPFAQGSFLIVRTSLFKQLGGFDDRYFMYMEDADFCKRVNEVSNILYYPDTTVIHKWAQMSHRNKKYLRYHLGSMYKYFKKWGWKFQ